jgi:TadE-like protein
MVKRSRSGQAMVEFALVAPIVVLILLILIDFGRGLFYYSEMAAGARESARQATLAGNLDSNTVPGGTALPGTLGVVPQLQRLAAFGYPVAPYQLSGSQTTPPSYGTITSMPARLGSGCAPAQISLTPAADVNVLYIFVYELDPSKGCAMRWDTGSKAQTARTGGHAYVVVDLKMKWTPVTMQYAGLGGANLVFDAQTVQREEW